ncbi:MAG: undecaprenyldiphospho-muramoylpentapeptide beta-N-acetylglucosaminyltransferase [Bacteroidaceae bacterium]|nr:undecaprenyldiphospho-muramoylpentapeptide beta-N-acetylglucosaminyltransferase [Bacteroidaceae bacterium]
MRVIISGGGTGGHIFPAISIANALKEADPATEILFVGAEGRMEMERVPQAGYEIKGLPVAGFDRRNLLRNVAVLFKLVRSQRMARRILTEFKPDVCVGVGGYASGPTLKEAQRMGIPTLIQEQNSYPGVTNKLLAKRADKICVAYDGLERFFPADKILKTGNPVRQALLDSSITREKAREAMHLGMKDPVVLIVGGSLGARTLNNAVMYGLNQISQERVQVVWQTGRYYYAQICHDLQHTVCPDNLHVMQFVEDMAMAYAAADIVISRAGASSISELCLLGKPTILVPSPNVAEDHQTKNARALSDRDAAIMVADAEARELLIPLALKTVMKPEKLASLSTEIRKLAVERSAETIAEEVIKLAKR